MTPTAGIEWIKPTWSPTMGRTTVPPAASTVRPDALAPS